SCRSSAGAIEPNVPSVTRAILEHRCRPIKCNRGDSQMIQANVSDHALRQSQRRGISRETLALVLLYHDRSRKVPGYARALWIGPRGRAALVRAGLPADLVERSAGVRAIVDLKDDTVLTVEHTCQRRRWA